MSTKTTLKRIALVAVSALGFGVLTSVSPANAAAATATASASLNTSYLTVVGTGTTNNTGLFYIDLTDNATTPENASSPGNRGGLVASGTNSLNGTAGEFIKVDVISAPTTSLSTDSVTVQAVAFDKTLAGTLTQNTTPGAVTSAAAATAGTYTVPNNSVARANFASNNWTYTATTGATGNNNRYWFALAPDSTSVIDKGYFTVRVRVHTTDTNQTVIEKTLQVRWVSSVADAGAKISVSVTGDLYKGQALGFTSSQRVTATLSGTNSGERVVLGGAPTASLVARTPVLNARIIDKDGALVEALATPVDSGVAADDHIASTDWAAGAAAAAAGNGVYGIESSGNLTADASLTNQIQARLTGSAVTGAAAVNIFDTSTLVASSTDLTLIATGINPTDSVVASDVASKTYKLPLSATTATVRINVDGSSANVANATLRTNIAWTGNYATSAVTPATQTSTTRSTWTTDASGNVDFVVTNSSPVAGAKATITVTGFASGSVTIVLDWEAPKVTTIAVVDPATGVYTKLLGTTTMTVSVTDQFGNAMANEELQPSLATGSANLSTTAPVKYATIKTGATGTATWSLTDAAADADDTDTASFASVSNTSATAGTYEITYKATLPTVSTMTKFYSHDFDHTTATEIATAVPSAGIYKDATGTKLPLVIARDLSKKLDGSGYEDAAAIAADYNDMIAFRVRSLTSAGLAATGAAVTITVTSGGHLLGVNGLPTTSRTFGVNSSGDVVFHALATGTGAITYTATAGAASTTMSMWIADSAAANGRTVAITGAATGTANGEGVPMTVTVKDRYGNPVTGVQLTIAASGVGAFAGGATTQSFTTDASGTYTFVANSYNAAGGSATFSATAVTDGDYASAAGFVGATPVDATLAAGKKSASATVTFAAGTNASQAAAEAASDAAAEAIDAANAATDAANLAAEAADAATVAAEEARDAADAATAAVEELATQVATLMAALKAQITTLANTVAKIAKKVRA